MPPLESSILLSFIQILTLLTFPIAWPNSFTVLFQIGGAVTVLGKHAVNFKCFFLEYSEAEVFYTTRIMWSLIPPTVSVLCMGGWFMVYYLHRIRRPASRSSSRVSKQEFHLWDTIRASVVALLYLLWPGL